MKLSRALLADASREGVISSEHADALWAFLQRESQHAPGFRFTHILYYLGGMLAIGAMTLFMTLGWESRRLGAAADRAGLCRARPSRLWGVCQQYPVPLRADTDRSGYHLARYPLAET